METRLAQFNPDLRPVLSVEKSYGAVRVSPELAASVVELADMMGGVVQAVATAVKGKQFGSRAVGSDSVMLLCESARNMSLFRGISADVWMRVKNRPEVTHEALGRAKRYSARVERKGVKSPSAPGGDPEGDAGALANWAHELAREWASSGMLFGAVREGGLGVVQDRFCMSGYLTETGGVPAEVYQLHVLASRDFLNYNANGIQPVESGVVTPPPAASVASTEEHVEPLAAAAAAMQIDDARDRQSRGSRSSSRESGSSHDSGKSKASEASRQRRSRREAMKAAGAPPNVAALFARLGKPLSSLTMGASYVARACSSNGLDLCHDDVEMLEFYFPDPAPRVVRNTNVPQAEQTPPQRAPAEQTPAPREQPQTAPPAPRQAPQMPPMQQQQMCHDVEGERPLWFHRCATGGCKCGASFNGGAGVACSKTCRYLFPCTRPTDRAHDYPSDLPEGFVGVEMPTSKSAAAKVLCAMPNVKLTKAAAMKYTLVEMQGMIQVEMFYGCAPGVMDKWCRVAVVDEVELEAEVMPDLVSNSSEWSQAGSGDEAPQAASGSVQASSQAAPRKPVRLSRAPRQQQADSAARKAVRAKEAARVEKRRLRELALAQAEAEAAAAIEAAAEVEMEAQEVLGQSGAYQGAAAESEVPMTQAERADAAEIRQVVAIVRGDVELCIRNVHDRHLREVLENIALTFVETRTAVQNPKWMPQAVLPAIKVAITSASQATEVSLTEQLLRHGTVEQTSTNITHVFMALTEMAGALAASRTMGSGSGGRGASTSDTRVNAAVLRAAERLAAEAEPVVQELQRLATASGARVEQNGPELRAAVAAAQQGEYGAEIALILHQESLSTPKGTMAPSANRMWNSVLVVAQRQRDALVSHFRRLAPVGVDMKLLVTAIVCGKLSVADMVPPATTKAGKAPEVRDAVMRAWPLVMQIMLEVHPRDDTAQAVMLKLALDVFAQAHVASDPVETLLKPVLEEMRTTSALYLLDGGAEHSWQVTMDNSMADALQSMALRSTLAGTAPALPAAGGLTTREQQARAAANAAEKKRLAAAGTGKQQAPEGAYINDAKWAAMSGKEKYEVAAKRDALREAAAAGQVAVPK